MSKDTKNFAKDGAPIPAMQRITGVPERQNSSYQNLQGGATVPTMQQIETAPEKRGATVPAMQPVTQTAPLERQTQETQTTGAADKK